MLPCSCPVACSVASSRPIDTLPLLPTPCPNKLASSDGPNVVIRVTPRTPVLYIGLATADEDCCVLCMYRLAWSARHVQAAAVSNSPSPGTRNAKGPTPCKGSRKNERSAKEKEEGHLRSETSPIQPSNPQSTDGLPAPCVAVAVTAWPERGCGRPTASAQLVPPRPFRLCNAAAADPGRARVLQSIRLEPACSCNVRDHPGSLSGPGDAGRSPRHGTGTSSGSYWPAPGPNRAASGQFSAGRSMRRAAASCCGGVGGPVSTQDGP